MSRKNRSTRPGSPPKYGNVEGSEKAPDPEKPYQAVKERLEQFPAGVFSRVNAGKVTALDIDAGTITASRFNLTDEEGRYVATLATTAAGEPGLALFRPDETRASLELVLTPDGPALQLHDAKGPSRAQLAVKGDLTSFLLSDAKGDLRAAIIIERDQPHLLTFPRRTDQRHVLTGTPLSKLKLPRARLLRALRANKGKAFDDLA